MGVATDRCGDNIFFHIEEARGTLVIVKAASFLIKRVPGFNEFELCYKIGELRYE